MEKPAAGWAGSQHRGEKFSETHIYTHKQSRLPYLSALSIYICRSITVAFLQETESHLPFNSRKLLESENRLPCFLMTSLHNCHGKLEGKWYRRP